MQATAIPTIPAGTIVETPSGRRAVTLTGTTVVTNSETGGVTCSNQVMFTVDDAVCPGGVWSWNTRKLTVIEAGRALRLIDTNGYTVKVWHVAESDVDAAAKTLLDVDAVADAAKWTSFGFPSYARDYRVA